MRKDAVTYCARKLHRARCTKTGMCAESCREPGRPQNPRLVKNSVAANWRETLGFLSNMPNAFGGADKTELFRV